MIRILCFFLLLSSAAFSQAFYVEPTEKGFEKEIIERIGFAGFKTVAKKEDSQFTVSYHYQQNRRNHKFEAYIKVVDSKSDTEVYRTSVAKRAANAFNGYQAMPAIISKLAEEELLPRLQKGF
nr:hypothetical protein [uncultured Dyadobacter sp.]